MRRIRTRLWATLLSACLLLSLLPVQVLADDTSGMTYEQLAAALAQPGDGIAFMPDETFVWPEEESTLTFGQDLLLGCDWTIPENITLVFPEEGGSIAAGDETAAPAVTIGGTVQLQKSAASTGDAFHPFQGVDVTWNDTATLCVTGESSASGGVLISSEETWTVEAGADLQADIVLWGTLQGNDGVIPGNVIVAPTNDSGEVHAELLGSLTIYGTLTVDSYPGIENSTTLRIVSGAKLSLPEGGLRLGQTRSSTQDVILGIGGELELWGENYINSQVLLLDDSSVLTLRENSSLDQFRDESAPVFDGGYLDGTGTVKVYCDPNDQEGTMPELFMTPFDEYSIDNDGHMNSKDFIRSDVCFWRSWADQCTITLHYDESLCTVKANSLVAGDNGFNDPSKTTLIVTGDGQSAQTPKGTWLEFQIDNIAEGYRIGSVTVNGENMTEGFINGAYGSVAYSNISTDYELTAVMEKIPYPLPQVQSVTLYTDAAGNNLAPESITLTSDNGNDKLYGKATFSDGVAHPTYYAMGQWQFSTDGRTWQDTVTWGDNRFDFWPGWEFHEELDFMHASYDLRLKVTPWDIYTTGDPVYSNVIHVNGGAEAAPSDSPQITDVWFQDDDVLKWHWDGSDFTDLSYLKLSFSRDGGATWDHTLKIIKESDVIQDSVLLNGIFQDMPEGTYDKIRFETFGASGAAADVYDWDCTLQIERETPGELPASVTFRKAGAENRYNLTVSGLTAGQRIVVQFYNAPGFDGDRWCPSSFADVTASTHVFSDKFMPDEAFTVDNDLYYIVQKFENTLTSGTEMSVKVTDLSDWTKGSLTASLAVDSVSFGTSGPQHTLDWSFPNGVTEEDLANCHLKLELYDADAQTWVLWDNGIYPRLTGGYILEDLLSDSDRPRGHFTKIRVSTVANSDSSVLGSCEEAIDLTVSEARASDLSAKAVFTKESDGQYTVETSGLTVGQVYCVITDYINESQAHTQVLATAGGVSATAATMTAENIPVVGDRESLLADASYRVLQFETSMSGSAQLSMTITDKSGWKPVNEAAADVTKATKVYFTDCRTPGYDECTELDIVFDGELTALERYDVYLYHPDTADWRWFAAATGTSGTTGYILEPHALNRNLDGHYTKVRVVSHPLDDSLGDAVYEQDIDLTVTNQTSEDSGCSVVYTRTGETETDALYTVNVTGLPEGDYYRIETYAEPSFDSTELTDVLGHTVASNSSAELSAKVKLDNDHLMKDAYYLARSVDSTQDGNTTCTVTITDLTGWKQCFPPCEHNWGEWTETPATCTQDGSRTRTCSLCHEVETQTISALGHDYQTVVTAPTCTEQGYTTHTCSRCHDSYVNTYVDALGHDWSTNDCTQQATCSRCDAVRPAGTHVWGEWTVTKEATCTEDGSKTRSCTSCGHPETEAIPAPGHDWGDWEVTKPSTETEDGSQIRTCKRCGETETEIISKWLKQELEWPFNIGETVTYTYGAPDFRAEATNNSTGGGAVIYASSNTDVATVDTKGIVTIQNAGATTITATAAAVPDKYAKTEIHFTLVVNKASLTITANDHTITYGQAPANGGYTASGFVKSEDDSVLTGTPVYTCTYQQFGKAGEYAISVSGLSAENYDITFVSGKLTVQRATDYTITLGGLEQSIAGLGPVSVSITPQDSTAKFTVEYQVNGTWTTVLPTEAGEYSVRAALTASDNLVPSDANTAEGTLIIQEGAFVNTGDANVSVNVDVDGDKAEVTLPDGALEDILANAGGDTAIDLGNLTGVKDVTLPGDLLDGLAKGDGALTISSEDASISMSDQVLDTIADAVTGPEDKVTLHMSEVQPEDMNEAQEAALESLPNAPAIVDLSLTVTHADGTTTTLSELNGNVEVTIPYTVPEGMEGQTAVACYISADGYITYIRAIYQSGAITFTTNHFSHYAVFVSEKPAVIVTDGSGSGLYEVGATVTITADSKSGYRFDHWEIVSGNVTLTDANRSETTFTMPAGNVEIAAVYTRISSGGGGSSTPTYAITVEPVQNGSVSVQPQKAAPGDTVTVTVQPDQGYKLGKLTVTDGNGKAISVTAADGKYTFVMPQSRVTVKADFVKHQLVFTDVPAAAYYAEAVEWAVSQGITAGTTATTFSPDSGCTRAQIVTFLWRAAGSPVVSDAMGFTDVPADAYYAEAVRWAVAQGITAGTSVSTFSPDSICTRGQIAAFLFRANGQPAATAAANPFSDVAADSYYYDAVLWAAENGITAGTSATTFSPNAPCTRAQIVTFLFRATGK